MSEAEHERLRVALGQALGAARTATLSVIDVATGTPYGALVNIAASPKGSVVMLLSQLAKHTEGLVADPRASLLVTGRLPTHGDVLTGFRASLMGKMQKTDDIDQRKMFLARHPYAETYAGFGDFSFWELMPHTIHAVAGFGRIVTVAAADVFPLA